VVAVKVVGPRGRSAITPRSVPRPRPSRRAVALYALWQVVLIGVCFLVYFGVRGLTTGAIARADENARRLVDGERAVGLLWEEGSQAAIAGHGALVTLANWVYIWGHLPLLAVTACWLFARRRERFLVLRNAIFISGVIGMVIFAAFPVTPPRLGILEVLDTVTDRSHTYRAIQPPGLTNQYAAFPSLHFGWNLLLGIVMVGAVRHTAARILWAATPVAMALAVVLTGNHFVIDVVAGGVVALAGLLAAEYLHRRPLFPVPRFVPPGVG
jgi:membrane-associated phospholipid phosphatase